MVARYRCGFINLGGTLSGKDGTLPPGAEVAPMAGSWRKTQPASQTFIDLLAPWWETSQFL
jgi:hypothetical protein